MSQYLKKYKPFLFFLGKFFLAYIVLTGSYEFYLSGFDTSNFEVDGITKSVAEQSKDVLLFFHADADAMPHYRQPCIKLFLSGKYVARIVEGCNAISVMILFVAFVVAFSGKWKSTLVFIGCGCLIIHVLNVARIALLCAAMYHFPAREHLLHGVIFPLFIYSVVFILWVIWVNKYSAYATGHEKG